MKKIYLLSFALLSLFIKLKAQAPPTINDKVFSINAWFIDNTDPNPATSLSGYWKQLADAGIKHVRLGGIAANWIPLYSWQPDLSVNDGLGDVNKLKALIDSCRKYGMEPIIEVGFAPAGTCSTSPLSGKSVGNAATIAANVVDVINNTIYTASSGPMKKIEWWIIANEPDNVINCPPPAGNYGGYGWNGSSSTHADSIANYIRVFSAAMKAKDASIKIIGPEMASFSPYTGYSQSIMMKSMVTSSASSNLTGTQSGNFILDEITFHHYPKNYSRSTIVNNPTDSIDGLRAKLTSNNSISQRKGLVTYINGGGSGRTSNDLKVGVTEYNIGRTDSIDESSNYSGMIQGNDFRSFLGGQWLSLTLAEAMSNPYSGHYCLWSVKEQGAIIVPADPCRDGFGLISSCTGNKRPLYHHMAMTSHLRGSFYYGTTVTNPAYVKTFAGVETGAGFHIMVVNTDATTSYNTTNINFNGGTGSSALNLTFSFYSVLTATANQSYTDTVPILARSTILYEFDCHGTFIDRIDYTEQMAITNQAPALRAIGNVVINQNVLAMGSSPIGGTINSTTVFANDTVYINNDLNIVGMNTKVTFLNSLLVIKTGKHINCNPNTFLELKNSIIVGENGGSWGGITANSNFHAGVGILIDKSVLLNAVNAISTDKLAELQVTKSIIASASGNKAVFMDRGQKFLFDNNLVVGYQSGFSTSRTQAGFISKITNNQFVSVKQVLEMKNDMHTNLEITCNLFRGFDKGLVAQATTLNSIGSPIVSAGNVFYKQGIQQDYLTLTGSSPTYYFGMTDAPQFALPGISNIPIVQASADRVCFQLFSSNCQPLINPIGIKENSEENSSLVIYPNPSGGVFNMAGTNLKGNYTLNIHDVLGRLISTKKLNMDTDKTVSFEILSKGLYFVTLENQNSKITKKVIVE
ncbi:MAG: T9SS type A sorting domain-containing protein [Bacteroidetes bacterium]|nr:T9SS type A sorting domain-containing protein [Bacteroidota bacterium]